MTHRFVFRILFHFLMATISFMAGGCSITGFAVGKMIENGAERRQSIAKTEFGEIQPGLNIILTTVKGQSFRGRFQGMGRYTDAEYQNRLLSLGLITQSVPMPGQKVSLHFRNGEVLTGRLIGYDHLTGTSKSPECIGLQTETSDTVYALLSALNKVVNARGDSIRADQISPYVMDGTVPSLRYLELDLAPGATDTIGAAELGHREEEVSRSSVLSLRTQDELTICFNEDEGRFVRSSQRFIGRDTLGNRISIPADNVSELEFISPQSSPQFRQFAVNEVTSAKTWRESRAGTIGLGVGAVIDAAAIVAIVAASGMKFGP